MDRRRHKESQDEKRLEKEVQQVLQDADIIARWAKKPFYIT